jgi:arylsulfatase A-like enzyme
MVALNMEARLLGRNVMTLYPRRESTREGTGRQFPRTELLTLLPLFLPVLVVLLCLPIGCGGDSGDQAARRSPQTGAAVPQPTVPVPQRFAYESADATSAPAAPTHGRVNVLLITLDTTRRDRLNSYGGGRGTTPHLEELAKEALLFEDCQVSVPVTLPSHTTIITGLEPFEHGVRNNGTYVLGEDVQTLAELMGSAGYATGAVMAAFVLARCYGMAQGFDDFDDAFVSGVEGSPVPQRIAEDVTRLGLSWIRAHQQEPWFAWLHYFDPHDPYNPPAPFDSRYQDPYDGELAYMDAHLGGLFRELKRMGLWDHTLIVITADHGEGLGDHGESTHTLFVYATTIDVPLIIKFPRLDPWSDKRYHARRVDGLVATTDILPTILSIAGVPETDWPKISGRDLRPLITQGQTARDYAYMETLIPELDYGWAPYRAIRRGPWKYILAPVPELSS